MVDSVSGNVATAGSRIFVSGLSSGLDTTAIINAAYEQKVRGADKIDTKITDNENKISSYQQLRDLAIAVKDSLADLSSDTSVVGAGNNAFDGRIASVSSSNAGVNPLDVLDITVNPGEPEATYEIEVLQKGKPNRVITSGAAGTFADKTTALGIAGTFSLGANEDGSTESITITAGQSLQSIANSINNTSTNSGVSAEVVSLASGEYQLLLSGTTSGIDIDAADTTNSPLQDLGLIDGGGAFTETVTASQQAQIRFQDILVTQNSNSFTELTEGIKFDILNAAVGTTITVTTAPDTATVKENLENFVSAYNEFRDFVIQNQQVNSDGTIPEDAVLFSEPTLEFLTRDIQSLFGRTYNTDSGIQSFGELGITLNDENKLVISDEAALDEVLLNDFNSVRQLFETESISTSENARVLRNTSLEQSFDIDFTVSVNGSGTITGVSANGDNSAFTINGRNLVGAEGTIYEGLTVTFVGNSSETFTITSDLGAANVFDTILNGYTNTFSGTIQENILNLSEKNVDLSEEASDIRSRAEDFRDKEIERIAKLEARIAAAEIAIAQIKAVVNALNDSDD